MYESDLGKNFFPNQNIKVLEEVSLPPGLWTFTYDDVMLGAMVTIL